MFIHSCFGSLSLLSVLLIVGNRLGILLLLLPPSSPTIKNVYNEGKPRWLPTGRDKLLAKLRG
jgi:hypothetical protein